MALKKISTFLIFFIVIFYVNVKCSDSAHHVSNMMSKIKSVLPSTGNNSKKRKGNLYLKVLPYGRDKSSILKIIIAISAIIVSYWLIKRISRCIKSPPKDSEDEPESFEYDELEPEPFLHEDLDSESFRPDESTESLWGTFVDKKVTSALFEAKFRGLTLQQIEAITMANVKRDFIVEKKIGPLLSVSDIGKYRNKAARLLNGAPDGSELYSVDVSALINLINLIKDGKEIPKAINEKAQQQLQQSSDDGELYKNYKGFFNECSQNLSFLISDYGKAFKNRKVLLEWIRVLRLTDKKLNSVDITNPLVDPSKIR